MTNMTVSNRCNKRNLYNHCKQVGKPEKMSHSYIQLKDCDVWHTIDRGIVVDYGYNKFKDNVWSEESKKCLWNKEAWVCELTINNEVIRECRFSKKEAFISLLDNMETNIRSYL